MTSKPGSLDLDPVAIALATALQVEFDFDSGAALLSVGLQTNEIGSLVLILEVLLLLFSLVMLLICRYEASTR